MTADIPFTIPPQTVFKISLGLYIFLILTYDLIFYIAILYNFWLLLLFILPPAYATIATTHAIPIVLITTATILVYFTAYICLFWGLLGEVCAYNYFFFKSMSYNITF